MHRYKLQTKLDKIEKNNFEFAYDLLQQVQGQWLISVELMPE